MVKAADGHFQMSGNLYFIFLFLTIYFFFVKRNSKCAISDLICYKTLKNIKNKSLQIQTTISDCIYPK